MVVLPSCSTNDQPKNVILIGWDGAQRNHLLESLDRKELPNLATLVSEGALVAIDIEEKTDTKAGWAQILTGYTAEINLVFSNGQYEPIPSGYTIFERLEQFFGPDNFVTVAVIGKKGNVGADPPQYNGDRVIPGQPFYNAKMKMDKFTNGLAEDELVGRITIEQLERHKDEPFFFFVHFAEVDKMGHRYGENSPEYNDALISADTWTGKIVETLKDLNLYEETLIYVTADHGFDEGLKSHKDAPYVFLATNDKKVNRPGERSDIAPTILNSIGLDLGEINPPLSGSPLLLPDFTAQGRIIRDDLFISMSYVG
jgi:hypothetical protein